MIPLLDAFIRIMVIGASVLYFQRVLKARRSFSRALLVLGVPLALFQLLYVLFPACDLYASAAHPVLSVLAALMEAAAILLLLRRITDSTWAEIFLFYSLYLLVLVASSLLLFSLSALFSGEKVAQLVATRWNDVFSRLISSVLQMSLLLSLAEGVSQLYKKQLPELRLAQFVPVFGAQAASAVVLIVMMRESGMQARMLPALAVVLGLYCVADGVLLSAFRAFTKNSELIQEVHTLREMQSLQKEHYLSMHAQLVSAQRMRHDYKNVLQTLDLLLEKGEAVRAQAFAASCGEALDPGGLCAYTGNEILDAVLSSKAQAAQRDGVRFSVELMLPDPIGIADVDLMSIFSNLLDNALEHVAQIGDRPRAVDVSGTVRAGLWVLTFANTYLGDRPPDFVTSKPNKALHGYGMGIVRSIVDQYGGKLSASVEAERLLLTVILNPSLTRARIKG